MTAPTPVNRCCLDHPAGNYVAFAATAAITLTGCFVVPLASGAPAQSPVRSATEWLVAPLRGGSDPAMGGAIR